MCPNVDGCLENLKRDDNDCLAVGGSRQRILNSRSYSPSKMFCFDQDKSIASYQSALIIRTDFALRQKIDDIIRNAFEGGLFVKWNRDSQRKKKRIDPFEPEYALTLEQYAVFLVVIYSIGCILAIFSFLFEVIIQQKMKQSNRTHIWIYFEQFFDGNRHYLTNLSQKLIKNSSTEVSPESTLKT